MRREEGVITIWLAGMLLVMLVFIGTVIEGVRINIAKSYSAVSLKLATESVLADYDYGLYKHYHILCINSDLVNIGERINQYAKMSFDNDALVDMQVNNVYVDNYSYVSSNISGYLKEQIAAYMTKKKGNTLSKSMLVDYVMQNFSSYGDIVPNSHLKKKKIYEVEYIIVGKDDDNENVESITSSISGFDAIKYSLESYKGNIRSRLMSMSESTIINRMCALMSDNMYMTYGRKINFGRCVNKLKVRGEYLIKGKFSVIRVGQYSINSTLELGY